MKHFYVKRLADSYHVIFSVRGRDYYVITSKPSEVYKNTDLFSFACDLKTITDSTTIGSDDWHLYYNVLKPLNNQLMTLGVDTYWTMHQKFNWN